MRSRKNEWPFVKYCSDTTWIAGVAQLGEQQTEARGVGVYSGGPVFNPRSWHFYHCKPLCIGGWRSSIIEKIDHRICAMVPLMQQTTLCFGKSYSDEEFAYAIRNHVEFFDYVRQALPIPVAGPSCRTVPIVTSMSQANNPEEPSVTFPPPAATGRHSLPTASRHPHQSCVVQIST